VFSIEAEARVVKVRLRLASKCCRFIGRRTGLIERSRDSRQFAARSGSLAPSLDAVVTRCLAKAPEERWQSAGDVAAALALVAPPPASGSLVQKRPLAWMAATGLAVLVAIALGALYLTRPPAQSRKSMTIYLAPATS
jgi:hypothetical protein